MPDFNFAREEGKEKQSGRESEEHHSSSSGRQTAIPPELQALPKVPPRPRVKPAASSPTPRSETPQTASKHEEVTEPPLPETTPPTLTTEPSTEAVVATHIPSSEDSFPVEQEPEGQETGEPEDIPEQKSRSRLPLFGFGILIFLLVALSFIWFVNPYPPLRNTIAEFFNAVPPGERPSPRPPPAADTTVNDTPSAIAPVVPSWQYYLQISSWKEQGKAQRDADRFRTRGIPVSVSGDFLPLRRATFYRVRLGPFAQRERAVELRDSMKGVIDPGAFIDSTGTNAHPKQSTAARSEPQSFSIEPLDKHTMPVTSTPVTGFAVKVSSYRELESAQREAGKLLKVGMPAFVTKISISGASWYRLLVGPFKTQEEAQRYAEIVSTTSGNEAYVIDLRTEQ